MNTSFKVKINTKNTFVASLSKKVFCFFYLLHPDASLELSKLLSQCMRLKREDKLLKTANYAKLVGPFWEVSIFLHTVGK